MRVPSRTSPAWRQAEFLLRRTLQEADLPPVRSPQALWNLLHQSSWSFPSWAELCADYALRELAAPLLAARRHRLPGILIWNVRYLKNTTAHNNQIKLAILLKATANRVALLQETHWSDHEIGVWSSCANYAVVRQNGVSWRMVSVYLPPDRVDDVIAQLTSATEDLPDVPTFWGRDLNLQNSLPRSNEVEAAANWAALLARHGSLHSHLTGPTRIGSDGESQIDAIACPADNAGSYSVRKAWKLSLSDHALLYADPAGVRPARRDEALTPAEFRSLPDEARADLRRLYAGLERTFEVPDVDLTGAEQPAHWIGPAAPGHLPTGHPAQDDNDADTEPLQDTSGDGPDPSSSPPWLPVLMEFGREPLGDHARLAETLEEEGQAHQSRHAVAPRGQRTTHVQTRGRLGSLAHRRRLGRQRPQARGVGSLGGKMESRPDPEESGHTITMATRGRGRATDDGTIIPHRPRDLQEDAHASRRTRPRRAVEREGIRRRHDTLGQPGWYLADGSPIALERSPPADPLLQRRTQASRL